MKEVTNIDLRNIIDFTDKLILASIICTTISVSYSFYITNKAFGNYSQDKYFWVDDVGAVKEAMVLGESHLDDDGIIDYSDDIITRVLDISWSDSHLELNSEKKLFTPAGFNSFSNSLLQSQWIERIKRNKENIKSSLISDLNITRKGLFENVMHYQVKGTYKLEFISSDSSSYNIVNVSATLTNVPYSINPRGLAIKQIIFSEVIEKRDENKEGEMIYKEIK